MSSEVGNADQMINRLINLNHNKRVETVGLRRTGFFQSRTVSVGDQECSVQQLITALGNKIKAHDASNLEDLESLKDVLKTVSDKEKNDRSFTSSLFHLFSSRDKDVAKLKDVVEGKIAVAGLDSPEGFQQDAIEINDSFYNLLSNLFDEGKTIISDIRKSERPFYINFNEVGAPSFSYERDRETSSTGIKLYMKRDVGVEGYTESYKFYLVDEVIIPEHDADGIDEILSTEGVLELLKQSTKDKEI